MFHITLVRFNLTEMIQIIIVLNCQPYIVLLKEL